MIAIFLLLIFFHTSTFSFVVFDPSNFAKNTLTASQTAEQILVLSSQYDAQLKQFETQLLQLKNLPASTISTLLSKNQEDMFATNEFNSRLQLLYGSINQIHENFSKRLDSAKLLNLDWTQYIQFEKNRIERSQSDAISISSNDLSAINRIKRDYDFANELELKIGTSSGIHEAMQILNVQVNRIITQNADLLRTLNVSINSQNSGTNILERNFKDQLDLNLKLSRKNLDQARYEGELKAFNLLGSGYFKNPR